MKLITYLIEVAQKLVWILPHSLLPPFQSCYGVLSVVHPEKKIIKYIKLEEWEFKNYVDQFLAYSDHLPTYGGLLWTFGALPTPCPRGHWKTWPPTPYVQYVPRFTAFTEKTSSHTKEI